MRDHSNVSLDERIERVHSLDLGPIKFKLAHNEDGHSLSIVDVERMEGQYRNFLILHLKYPEKRIVPCKEVDTFWHAHILDTYKYAADCEHVLGRFLHHFPYFGLRGEADAEQLKKTFIESMELYRDTFGTRYSAASAADCQVSSCDAPQCNPQECHDGEGIELARPSWDAFVNAAQPVHA